MKYIFSGILIPKVIENLKDSSRSMSRKRKVFIVTHYSSRNDVRHINSVTAALFTLSLDPVSLTIYYCCQALFSSIFKYRSSILSDTMSLAPGFRLDASSYVGLVFLSVKMFVSLLPVILNLLRKFHIYEAIDELRPLSEMIQIR